MVHDAGDGIRSVLTTYVAEAEAQGRSFLNEVECKDVLGLAGVGVPESRVVGSPDEAVDAVGYPCVVKAVSPDVSHKSDVGGVRLGLGDADEVRRAMAELADRYRAQSLRVDAFLVERMCVDAGHELVIGAVRRLGVGWVVMVGLGGIFVEALGDVCTLLTPVSRPDIARGLRRLAAWPALTGERGTTAIDLPALEELLLRFAGTDGLLSRLPASVTEIDLNPVLATGTAATVLDARMVLGDENDDPVPSPTVADRALSRLLEPRAIAVVGASATEDRMANRFIRDTRAFGFDGRIFPIHPTAETVDGLPAYPSFDALPETVDYAYVGVKSDAAVRLLPEIARKAHVVQVVSSGFSESGDRQTEEELRKAAAGSGVRVLGPNCMGIHSPRGRVTFLDEAPREAGTVALASQSGSVSIDVLRLGTARGVRFHSGISLGNCVDFGAADAVADYLDDPDVDVIGLYLESPREGRRLFDLLRATPTDKPIVLLAGGRTPAGASAARSHTGALIDDHAIWPALASQTGVVLVDDVDGLVNALVAFERRDPLVRAPSTDVVLFGNGGGTSVLASDVVERCGLRITPFDEHTRGRLATITLPPGASLENPIDLPAPAIATRQGAIADDVLDAVMSMPERPGAALVHVNVGVVSMHSGAGEVDVVSRLMAATARARKEGNEATHVLFVLRGDERPATTRRIAEYAAQARQVQLPVFADLASAARAAHHLITFDRERAGGR